ncbi:LOW QUALITY PROTEIN: neuropeptide CCHamide-1 receptor [Drosophila sulfurigaster albostrigata]|uniref:LOW QUALITY PROTEIN: neuropeptide CCHamide-1 receptor n=1 Tax=Drosophila sulfurigaster albostrigata TaxID=89887 RepID=UPI002D21D03C|nr:LOW QUALITY PROTEIN: neuropeptide CCHamide-1 receptor [Drosophila sulfurigaster albostrigata]
MMTSLLLNDFNSVAMDMDMDLDSGSGAVSGSVSESPLTLPNTTRMLWDLVMETTSQTTLFDDNISIATTETPYVPYGRRPETYIVPILFAIIFVVGVLGNGTLIVVFLSVRQMRNVPNTYILSLALADLLVILTTVPLVSTIYTVEYWPWGSFLCTVSEFMKDVSIGVSVFTLTALSSDRYFAIVDPLRKFHAHGGGRRATRMTLAIAVSIWLLAILCGLPALIGSNIKPLGINHEKSIVYCYPYPVEWGKNYAKIMVMLHFLVYYAIPLVIIAVFYVLIALHLMYSASVPGEMQGAVRQVRARRKVAVTVLAFVVIFGICFLPYHVFFLWFYYWPTAEVDYNMFWHVLRIVGFCMSFANSCANPVALYFVSGAFRKHFNRYLFCRGASGRRKQRDTFCMHRDTSMTSTASKRFQSRHSCYQSTMRSCRLQETTITTLPNGGLNGGGASSVLTTLPPHNDTAGYEFAPLSEFGPLKDSQLTHRIQESPLN